MKRYQITLDNQEFDVQVLGDPRTEQVRVQVNGETFTVGVRAIPVAMEATTMETTPATELAAARPALSPAQTGTAAVGFVVNAPLPGVIKSIAVRPGQMVTADDELLVIEAMKMDNIIRAPRGGTVGTLHVTEGRQVAYGEPLLDFVD